MQLALDPVFFSTFMYAACKVVGERRWKEEVLPHELSRVQDESWVSPWPAFRTLRQVSRVAAAQVYVDAGTYITRARSVAAGHFLRSDKDVWVTCDDDIEADECAIRKLVEVARATRHGVAMPYLNRDGKSMTFRTVTGPTVYEADIPLRRVDRVGFGLVALHRDLVERLAKLVPHFASGNSEGAPVDSPAVFLEGVDQGVWIGEDYYFSRLCEQVSKPLFVLLDTPCTHAGLTAKLDTDGRILVIGEETAKRLEDAQADVPSAD